MKQSLSIAQDNYLAAGKDHLGGQRKERRILEVQPGLGVREMLKEDQCHPLDWSASNDNFAQHLAGAGVGRQPFCEVGRGSLRCSNSWVAFLWKPFLLVRGPLLESHFFGLNVDLC